MFALNSQLQLKEKYLLVSPAKMCEVELPFKLIYYNQ